MSRQRPLFISEKVGDEGLPCLGWGWGGRGSLGGLFSYRARKTDFVFLTKVCMLYMHAQKVVGGRAFSLFPMFF